MGGIWHEGQLAWRAIGMEGIWHGGHLASRAFGTRGKLLRGKWLREQMVLGAFRLGAFGFGGKYFRCIRLKVHMSQEAKFQGAIGTGSKWRGAFVSGANGWRQMEPSELGNRY